MRRFQKLWDETPSARRHVLGLPQTDDAYALCNERVLQLAQQNGAVQLIALWDGGGGDGPGGTADDRAGHGFGYSWPTRCDIFFGSGDDAGARAGDIQQGRGLRSSAP
jgi:hypothetical protein